MSEPMKGFSVPGDEVKGPEDLVARMNEATSDNWETVPLPARQQLGWKERYQGDSDTQSPELKDFLDESPENLLHSDKLSGSSPDASLNLTEAVTYHLEATEPPAEPAGAPGSDGYNRLNRMVAPAEGYEHPADFTIEQGAGVRTFRLPENVGLSEEEQAKVDGVGPHAPAKSRLGGDERNLSDDTRERSNLSASKLDPNRNEDGSLKDPEKVQEEVAQDGPAAHVSADVEEAGGDSGSDDDGGRHEAVPDGSTADVLEWVGDDQDKARRAIEAEQGKEKPRTGLLRELNEKL
jgi:hypothetical protein